MAQVKSIFSFPCSIARRPDGRSQAGVLVFRGSGDRSMHCFLWVCFATFEFNELCAILNLHSQISLSLNNASPKTTHKCLFSIFKLKRLKAWLWTGDLNESRWNVSVNKREFKSSIHEFRLAKLEFSTNSVRLSQRCSMSITDKQLHLYSYFWRLYF